MKTLNLSTTPSTDQLPKAIHAKNNEGEKLFTVYDNGDFEGGEIMLGLFTLIEALSIMHNFDIFYNNLKTD